ncbi:MAG: hypothetical protein IJ088_09270 [Clostridia bacterium]|nr:hypothetical protein [Clostridia bacterium]
MLDFIIDFFAEPVDFIICFRSEKIGRKKSEKKEPESEKTDRQPEPKDA